MTDLTPKQQTAAVLDAQGHRRYEIARIVDVSEATIAGWRRGDEYSGEVERLRASQLAEIESQLQILRTRLVEGATKAVEALIDQLEAETKEGKPYWRIRQRAAELLTGPLVRVVFPEEHSSGGDQTAAASHATVVVQLGDGDRKEAPLDVTAVEE